MKAVQEKEARYLRLRESPGLRRAKLLADAYCAAFVIRKDEATVKAGLELTYAAVQRMEGGPELAPLPLREEIERLTQQYQFLHYHVEFPDVFQVAKDESSEGPGWTGGFDCVLGNPPWERVKLQEQEFFASRDEQIANAANSASRKKLIASLAVKGVHTRDDLADLAVDELTEITGQSEDEAKALIMKAREHWFAGQE